jgi:hypothetical protein
VLPPGVAGGVGRGGSDRAAPVVVGALDWLLLVCSGRLYLIAIPTITRMITSAASQGQIDLRLVASGLRRRGRAERWGSASRGSDMLFLLSRNRRNCVDSSRRLIADNVPVEWPSHIQFPVTSGAKRKVRHTLGSASRRCASTTHGMSCSLDGSVVPSDRAQTPWANCPECPGPAARSSTSAQLPNAIVRPPPLASVPARFPPGRSSAK